MTLSNTKSLSAHTHKSPAQIEHCIYLTGTFRSRAWRWSNCKEIFSDQPEAIP